MRLRYITNVRFQFSFTIAFVFGLLVSFAISAVACIAALQLLSQSPALSPEQQSGLLNGVRHLIDVALVSGAVLAVAAFFVGGYLSHRFSGPMRRLHGWLIQKLEGEHAGELQLRAGDELHAVADALDRLARKYP